MFKTSLFLLVFLLFNITTLNAKTYRIDIEHICCDKRYIIADDLQFDEKILKQYCENFFSLNPNSQEYNKIKGKIPQLDPVILFTIELAKAHQWLNGVKSEFEQKKDINVLKQTYKNFSRSNYIDFIISRIENTRDFEEQRKIMNYQFNNEWINIFHKQLSKIKPKQNYFYWKEFLKKYKIKEVMNKCEGCD